MMCVLVSILLLGLTLFLGALAEGLPPQVMVRPRSPSNNGRVCEVMPSRQLSHSNGTKFDQVDDTPQLLQAFADCSGGGTVLFPEGARYSIASRLHLEVTDLTVDWRGFWEFSTNLSYWRDNGFPVAFQNHRAGFILSGQRIRINGHGTGGIDGNGDAWYEAEKGSTQAGRPMPFVLWNVSDVVVQHFSVVQSPLWSINVMNGSNLWFDDIYVNNTATSVPQGENWVQNTDGFDTMDTSNVALTNFIYQGDDAIAIKPRSFNIYCQNLTIHGGNGVAIGSLGQYPGEDASVANVIVKDVHLTARNGDMHNSAYIKTWIGEAILQPRGGYESAGQPNGGGFGSVTNILFANFHLDGAANGPAIDQDSGNNGSFSGTSNLLISNIAFVNFTGVLDSKNGRSGGDYKNGTGIRTARVSCSERQPCYNIEFQNIALQSANGSLVSGVQGECKHILPGTVHGMVGNGC